MKVFQQSRGSYPHQLKPSFPKAMPSGSVRHFAPESYREAAAVSFGYRFPSGGAG
jgi:hypothetical protein